MRSTETMSLLRGLPLKRRKPSQNSNNPTLPLLSGSKMSERCSWSSWSISKSSNAWMASGSLMNSAMIFPGKSTAYKSSMQSDIFSGIACSGDTSKRRRINVVSRVHHNFLSASRARRLELSKAMAATMVLSTKIALMTLNRPIVITKTKQQQTKVANPPYVLWMCSNNGVPPFVLQSPKLHRKVVIMDRGTLSKNGFTVSTLPRPKASRKTKLTM
mmetsp:Transcript_6453/g.14744  ORF Transcript_6453/g.14744 Transcript_6453/m.14744 type:complete len:216 (-) Transcript_6453:629-1276(-)